MQIANIGLDLMGRNLLILQAPQHGKVNTEVIEQTIHALMGL